MTQARTSQLDMTSTLKMSIMHMEWERNRWWDTDCTSYSAERSGEITYKPNRLTSQEFIEYCHEEEVRRSSSASYRSGRPGPGGHHPRPGGHHPGPGGYHPGPSGHHPGSGGHDDGPPQTQTVCRTVRGDTITRYVQLRIQERVIFPWEKEQFSFCLKRDDLNFSINAAAYSYERQASVLPGYPSVNLMTLVPLEKKPMAPDEDGITIEQAGSVEGVVRVVLSDKWRNEYKAWPGEKTRLTVKLMKKGFLWTSKAIIEETYELNPSQNNSFEFNIADYQLEQGKYHFQCAFTRLGAISKPIEVKMPKTASFELRMR